MNKQKGSGLIAVAVVLGAVLLVSGCGSANKTSWKAIDSCTFRGGHVERVCLTADPNNPYSCMRYGDSCVGYNVGVKEWCKRERRAWEEAEEIDFYPRPPSYCF